MKNIAFFVSGYGSNLKAILESIESGFIPIIPKIVISSKEKVRSLEIAKQFNIPSFVENSDRKITDLLISHDIDLIACCGYINKIGEEVLKNFENRILNIHPSLLPKFGGLGMYGIYIHEKVIESGEKISGATIHLVDEVYDNGKIIAQKEVNVSSTDTPQTLQSKILKIEHQLYSEVLLSIVLGQIDL